MKWLFLILLVLGGWRQPDVRYDRACVRLEAWTRGALSCDALEARFWGPAQDHKNDEAAEGGRVRISNGF